MEPVIPQMDTSAIDLDKYDFDGLRQDVMDILSLPQAGLEIAKWVGLGPAIAGWIIFMFFSRRMSMWALVPYGVVVTLALILASVGIGLCFVLHRRVAATNAAADRVIYLTSELHRDYLQVRSGDANIPMATMATALTEQLIFPLLSGGALSATSLSGPVGFVLRPVLSRLINGVQERVLEALNSPTDVELAVDDSSPPLTGAEVVATVATASLVDAVPLPPGLDEWYEKVHAVVLRVVSSAGTVATGSMAAVAFVAAMPLVMVLAAGYLLT